MAEYKASIAIFRCQSGNNLIKKSNIFFLLRSLDSGGAERQLVLLAKELTQAGHFVTVVVFYGGGLFDEELTEASIRLINLDKRGRWDVIPFLSRLVLLLRKERPAILHAYLTMQNVLVVIIKPLLLNTQVVWGVRASNMNLSQYDWLSRFTYFLECKLSRFADLIIANSHAGKQYAVLNGFPENKVTVIANGIDTKNFKFEQKARQLVRSEWGLKNNELLIGIVARLDPMKDHETFLKAASQIATNRQNVRFVCVGDGVSHYTNLLKHEATELGLGGKLIWAGARDDMASVYSALDIACSSSSSGEGFSNTIAEAMACSIPVVATNVGDSAWIVGDTGEVVESSNSSALARALMDMVDLPSKQREDLGNKARKRILMEFSVEALVSNTEQALGLI